jgi:hypothetical protein
VQVTVETAQQVAQAAVQVPEAAINLVARELVVKETLAEIHKAQVLEQVAVVAQAQSVATVRVVLAIGPAAQAVQVLVHL